MQVFSLFSMKLIPILLLVIAIPASGEKPSSVKIADVKISRGMDKEKIRNLIPQQYTLWCAENGPNVPDEITTCAIVLKNANEEWNAGEILFKDEQVLSAHRIVGTYTDAYSGFLAFHQLLEKLTNGKYDCGIVKTGAEPYQFFVALPEKTVSIMLFTQQDEKGIAVLREGLRRNPNPDLKIADCWPMLGHE
jgi:hypothetical protein